MIENWITENAVHGIEQGSCDWLNLRKYTIGGSSIHAVTRVTKTNGTLKKFLYERVGLKDAWKNDAPLRWGKIFEIVAKQIAENTYNCKIIGDKSYIIGKGEYLGSSYSPDGIGCVDGEVVLFEFKCPFSRKISLMDSHAYQVKMGLNMIPIAAYGLLCEFTFKCCDFYSEIPDKNTGLICVYSSLTADFAWNAEYIKKYGDFGYLDDDYSCNDLGKADTSLLLNILIDIAENPQEGDLYYDKVCFWIGADINGFKKHLRKIETPIKNIGVFRWYLQDSEVFKISREDSFLREHMAKIKNIIEVISDCDNKNEAEKTCIVDTFINHL